MLLLSPNLKQMRKDACLTSEQIASYVLGTVNSAYRVKEVEAGSYQLSLIQYFLWFYHCATAAKTKELDIVHSPNSSFIKKQFYKYILPYTHYYLFLIFLSLLIIVN